MKRPSNSLPWLLTAGACLVIPSAALAHPGHFTEGQNSLVAGLLHPLTGADHLLAMLASGLLAVRVGTRKALWIIPVSFVFLMLFGGMLAVAGVPMPNAEWGVSLSVIVLGLMVAMLPKVPMSVAAAWVALFAIFHGHAHMAELGAQSVVQTTIGFAITTLALHTAAIGTGMLAIRAGQARFIRFAGAAIALAFAVVLVGF